MNASPLMKRLLAGIFILAFAFASTAFGQGITSAGMSGFVTDKQGKPVAGATVTAVHTPTGTKATTVSRPNGQFNLSGLRVGGPYEVSAASAGVNSEPVGGLYLSLEQSADVNLVISSEVVKMEAFTVAGSRDTLFDSGKMGTGTSLSAADISNVATVRRNIQDIAQMDSRLYLGSLDQGGNLSAQGQNFRFNSFLIDGVQAVDPFGLNGNGFSSLRSPIPLDAIQSLNIELSPYSGRFAGFTGALLNAVTKSGTNDFHGSAYYEYTDQDYRDKNPVSQLRETFKERTFGATVGGPILKDKLFFFLAYDDFRRLAAPPQANFIPNSPDLAAVIAAAKAYGYDPGTLAANNVSKQKTYVGKIDWNISPQHRLSATYRRNYGNDISFVNYTNSTSTSLSNIWFAQPRNTDSYTGQLFSQWTPDLHTEVSYSYTKYDGTPKNFGKAFPQVQVTGISGTRLDTGAAITNGAIFLGTDSSRQLNQIITRENNARAVVDYSIGDHTLSGGLEDTSTKYANAFVQFTNGYYTFTAANWQTGLNPTAYQLAKPFAGFSINDAIARWKYDAYAVFVDDSWRFNKQLTLLGSIRYDYPHIGQAPPVATGFSTAGFVTDNGQPVTRNNTTNNGNATWGPRFGFTYKVQADRPTQIRGGLGLFQGKNPAVWISNAYSNAGATYSYTASAADLAVTTFNPNPNTQTVPGSATPAPSINVTDPKFKQPAIWKANLAVDHKLPFLGLNATAEGFYTLDAENINTQFLNYALSTDGPDTLPDGRLRYGPASAETSSTTTNIAGRRRNPNFADVFYLTNTKKGYTSGGTLSVDRPMKDGWAWSASYTHTHATEVSPTTSSTASSNYSNRASFNPNEDTAGLSNTNIRDRFVVSYAREFQIIPKFKTTAALVFQARTGHPYSWVFRGDANGDGFTFNDLLYVPTGPSDPKVAWANTTERDNFFTFVNGTTLKNYMGGHPGRNTETSPWNRTLDLKLSQEIPLYGNVKGEVYLNIINFASLLWKKSWGYLEEVPFSYKRAVAGATYNPAGNGGLGVWNYTFNAGTLDGVPITVNDNPVSRWQMQGGLRVKF
jgi:outer membrane receptor for ferrienterochelin and colicin